MIYLQLKIITRILTIFINTKMTEIEKLKKRLKRASTKPKLVGVRISKVEKKRKKRIVHNPKEFSEKYLYN